MSIEITLPQLGVEMTAARLAEWVSADRATIRRGEVVAVVETDKVTYELEAPGDGTLHAEATVGEEYAVGARLGLITDDSETYQPPVGPTGGSPPETTPPSAPSRAAPGAVPTGGRKPATPLARRIAAAAGIDLEHIDGTGPGGAIRRGDVEALRDRMAGAAEVSTAKPLVAVAPSPGIALTPMRRSIAEHMLRSLQTTAQMTDVREVDVTELVALRARLRAGADRLGFSVSLTNLVLAATAQALRAHPELNATMRGDELVRHADINLGLAVAVADGLLVPVVRHADRLTLRGLHHACAELAERTRSRSLRAEELEGGTFTVSNVGSYGSHFGTPVINLPQVAILATGAVLERPVVRNGVVVAGRVMHLSLTVDHRVIDGQAAGRFQSTLADLLGEPELLLAGSGQRT